VQQVRRIDDASQSMQGLRKLQQERDYPAGSLIELNLKTVGFYRRFFVCLFRGFLIELD
jgi:hypothetical protein